MNYLEENYKKLRDLIEKGKKGEYKIPLRELSMQITNKCNNYCIMCPCCNKEYENRTFIMTNQTLLIYQSLNK